MSKVGQAVYEGQEFAQNYYNEPKDKFLALAAETFREGSIQYESAVEEFNTIGNDLDEFFNSEPPYIPGVDDDRIPY